MWTIVYMLWKKRTEEEWRSVEERVTGDTGQP